MEGPGIGCLFGAAAVEIQRRFASNDLPEFVTESLAEQGIDLATIVVG